MEKFDSLQNNLQNLQLIIKHTPAAIAIFDREMRYIAYSQRFLVDYNLPDLDLKGKSHYEVFPEISQKWKDTHQRCLAGSIEKADAEPFPRGDGKIDYVRWEIQPWFNTNQKIGGIILFSEVITDAINKDHCIKNLTRLYATLSQINQTIIRVKSPEELLDNVCKVAVAFGEFGLAWIGNVNFQKGEIIPINLFGLPKNEFPFEKINYKHPPFHQGLISQAIIKEGLVYQKDILSEPAMQHWHNLALENNYHAAAVLPIMENGEVGKILMLFSHDFDMFAEKNQRHLLIEMAGDISFALEYMRHEELRANAEDALQESETNLREAQRVAKIGSWKFNIDTNELYWSDELYNVFEVEKSNFKTGYDSFIEQVHPDDRPNVLDTNRKARQIGDPFNVEYRILTKNGNIKFINEVGYAKKNESGQVNLLFGTAQDITERKQTEQKKRESDERFTRLVSDLNDIVWTTSLDGKHILDLNHSFENIFGLPIEQFKENTLLWFDLVYPDDRNIAEKSTEELLSLGKSSTEYRIIRPDGEVRWILDRKSMIYGDDGKPIAIGGIAKDITDRKKSEEKIKIQLAHQTALRDIDLTIMSSTDIRLTLKIIVDKIIQVQKVDAACFSVYNPHTYTFEYITGNGFSGNQIQSINRCLSDSVIGTACMERRTLEFHNIRSQDDIISKQLLTEENFTCLTVVPLLSKGTIKGVLELFFRGHRENTTEWMEFLTILSGQAAIAIENADLFDNIHRSNIELKLAYDATIEGWSRAMDLRDRETEGHTQRVTNITLKMAQSAGLHAEDLIHVRRGALLHDIGKLGVPDEVLFKSGNLSEEEWELMRKHPHYAYEMLCSINYLRPALDIPYCHHEKWDGSGYPRGLKGEQIPLAARLFAVVDVWDALRSDRPYREAWPEEKVRVYINSLSGTHFDPRAVEIFKQVISELDKGIN